MVRILEFRELLDAAQRYLAGACSIQELSGRVGALVDASKLWSGHPVFLQMATEWSGMVDRRWNECGHVAAPLSEEQFRAWLLGQMTFLCAQPQGLDINAGVANDHPGGEG
ncbi:hypothetical protein ACFJIW_12060 [Tahibacter sp. UC22_41]|uniref:hypothetical protein n=1 Tax=Tahibacter sp. UC22_41 TaxID=3350178 RepID=UPI0036D8FEC1